KPAEGFGDLVQQLALLHVGGAEADQGERRVARRQFQRLLPGPGGVVEAGADVADVRGEAASRVVERTRGEYEAAVDAVEGVEDRLHRRQAVVGAGAVERGQALRPRFGDQLADEVVAEAADRAGGRGERRAERRR